jgi:hypothetical protein
MALINRVPSGLLGLLDLKAQGENPAQLAAHVQATIDLRDFYALATRGTISQASTLTALGNTAGIFLNLTVPQGELWLVTGMTAHLSAPPLGAAATFAAAVGYIPADVGRFVALGPTCPVIATGADFVAEQDAGGTYFLQPGDQPQVYASTFTGGPHGVRLTFQRARFLV